VRGFRSPRNVCILLSDMARPGLTSAAAIASVIAASSCCVPVLPFIAAAGLAGGSAFLNEARPYLLGASVLLIVFAFWQAARAKRCNARRSAAGMAVLWIAAAFVAASILFPQTMANAAVDLLAGRRPATPLRQPALQHIDDVAVVRDAFNAAKDQFRVLLFLSPT
jgi:hypothetical protein